MTIIQTPTRSRKESSKAANESPFSSDSTGSSINTRSPEPGGAHRDGYSEDKCRYVLVRYCSDIPRNYNYTDGLQFVYERLREFLGDENLDLSIGVLYEFIEIRCDYTWEEGSAFRRWQHDHALRAKDLGNAHIPRLGNIVVAPVVPTERLQQWRNHRCERKMMRPSDLVSKSCNRGNFSLAPRFGILARDEWQINHTTYVSSSKGGTHVHFCPTPQELHEFYWNEGYGRGGRLVEERTIVTGDLNLNPTAQHFATKNVHMATPQPRVTQFEPFITTPKKHSKSLGSSGQNPCQLALKIFHPAKNKSNTPLYHRTKCGCDSGGHASFTVRAYEDQEAVKTLPDPATIRGRAYYRDIPNVPLPENSLAHNAIFARKHGLLSRDQKLPESLETDQKSTANEDAVMKAAQLLTESQSDGRIWKFHGPFTADLFKDGGVDYQWTLESPLCNLKSEDTDLHIVVDGPIYDGGVETRETQYLRPAQCGSSVPCGRLSLYCSSHRQFSESLWTPSSNQFHSTTDGNVQHHLVRTTIETEDIVGREITDCMVPIHTNSNDITECSANENERSLLDLLAHEGSAARIATNTHELKNLDKSPFHKEDKSNIASEDSDLVRMDLSFPHTKTSEPHEIDPHSLDTSINIATIVAGVNNKQNETIDQDNSIPGVLEQSPLSGNNRNESQRRLSPDSLLMDLNRDLPPIPLPTPIKPLCIRKISADHKPEPLQKSLLQQDHRSERVQIVAPEAQKIQYPPRRSSLRRPNIAVQATSATLSHKHSADYSTTMYTPRSVGSDKGDRRSDPETVSSIMGNFVLLESPDFSHTRNLGREKQSSAIDAYYNELARKNPYEFEPETPRDYAVQGPTVSDFLRHSPTKRSPRRLEQKRSWHLKNSQSENDVQFMAKLTESSVANLPVPQSHVLSRSGSSPSISPSRQNFQNYETQTSLESYDYLDLEYFQPPVQDRHQSGSEPYSYSQFYPRRHSPTRDHAQTQTKPYLEDVIERDEMIDDLPVSPRQFTKPSLEDIRERREVAADTHETSTRRPRSPMKKMFGEGGWLGTTTDPKEPPSTRYKKPGMMIKIRNKIEEIGQKADLSPIKHAFSKVDENIILKPVYPISVSPFQQAKIYSDLELVVTETANTFLMTQFKAGRISVESVKKAMDFWKSKGRPQVVEFQFDQLTQRDLIVANQKSFRFHGESAGSVLQVNAMLFTWKENAREMAVRTFCTPDAIIRKHLHDAYKILEMLGAPILTFLALQENHSFFNAIIRKTGEVRRTKDTAPPGIERVWCPPPHSSAISNESTRVSKQSRDTGSSDGTRYEARDSSGNATTISHV